MYIYKYLCNKVIKTYIELVNEITVIKTESL